jgi:cytochrome c oxidase subunit 2|uniref:Cytochrome c oxidase subunit 2 n=1 Tax=Ochromonas danica TaxID=2986 RepID=Q9G925_OCHDN|nr:cytochrome c oxidase subunit 2 [Ochromonas danica]AAG18380.1 cytochrome c oxidase subunit 2 [Ochromonas danica]
MITYINNLILIVLNNIVAYCDAAEPWQISPQDPATPVMEGMIFFHNYLMFYMILIGILVFFMLFKILVTFGENKKSVADKFTHSSLLEIIWTILPAIVLILIAVPSFTLLYSLDELVDPALTLKIIGHQWYWSYEYSDYAILNNGNTLSFDSYMTPTSDLDFGHLRLLEVDNRVLLPTNTHIRILVTAADVIHSWAVPSFGIKVDGTPGRLTQGSLFIKREGVYFGQCSEICGINHAFMPIVVRTVSVPYFTEWILYRLDHFLGE